MQRSKIVNWGISTKVEKGILPVIEHFEFLKVETLKWKKNMKIVEYEDWREKAS